MFLCLILSNLLFNFYLIQLTIKVLSPDTGMRQHFDGEGNLDAVYSFLVLFYLFLHLNCSYTVFSIILYFLLSFPLQPEMIPPSSRMCTETIETKYFRNYSNTVYLKCNTSRGHKCHSTVTVMPVLMQVFKSTKRMSSFQRASVFWSNLNIHNTGFWRRFGPFF